MAVYLPAGRDRSTRRRPVLVADEHIVVVMEKRVTLDEYFRMPETNRPEELIYGVVREPPAPTYGHQRNVFRLATLLDAHVRTLGLGELCVSPISVVLDREAELVVELAVLASECFK